MAGTVTVTHYALGSIRKVECAVVADAADGSVPDTALPAIEGRLLALATSPGSTQPSANYDVTVDDQYGHDVLEGVGANRSASANEKVPVVYSGTGTHPPVDDADALTLKIANNLVHSAEMTIALYYALGG